MNAYSAVQGSAIKAVYLWLLTRGFRWPGSEDGKEHVATIVWLLCLNSRLGVRKMGGSGVKGH